MAHPLEYEQAFYEASVRVDEQVTLHPDELARQREYRILEAQGPAGRLAVSYAKIYQEFIVRGHGTVVHEDIAPDTDYGAIERPSYGLSSLVWLSPVHGLEKDSH